MPEGEVGGVVLPEAGQGICRVAGAVVNATGRDLGKRQGKVATNLRYAQREGDVSEAAGFMLGLTGVHIWFSGEAGAVNDQRGFLSEAKVTEEVGLGEVKIRPPDRQMRNTLFLEMT
jgi:hypothetical protein